MFATHRAFVDGQESIGLSLRSQMRIDVDVGRRDLVRLLEEEFDLVVCASVAPGGSWESSGDQHSLTSIARIISRVRTRQLVVLSGTDVYGCTCEPDELSPIGTGAISERGRQRAWFEEALREYHPSMLVLRLPAALADRIDPALMADIATDGSVAAFDPVRLYQVYDSGRLGADLQRALHEDLKVANLVSEPFGLADVARQCDSSWAATYFAATAPPQRHTVRTMHAATFGIEGAHVVDRADALAIVGRWWNVLTRAADPVRRVS